MLAQWAWPSHLEKLPCKLLSHTCPEGDGLTSAMSSRSKGLGWSSLGNWVQGYYATVEMYPVELDVLRALSPGPCLSWLGPLTYTTHKGL